jgi:hypothetical protein
MEIKIVAIDGTPKQVVVTDATGCNPQKLKWRNTSLIITYNMRRDETMDFSLLISGSFKVKLK